jgi:O-antigen/teichoic acid export membrane protein
MDLPVRRAVPPAESTPHRPLESAPRTDRRVLLNTGALAGSSLWRIGISFVLQILIANRLGAEGLGQYAAAMAYLNVCQIMSELGLPQLLVRDLARFPGRRRLYFRAALILQLGASFLVWGALVGISFLFFQPTTQLALIVVASSLPLYAISSACATIFQAGERMEFVMGVEVSTNTLILIASILLLWTGGTVVHLAAAIIGTQAFSALLCLFLLRRYRLLAATSAAETRYAVWTAVRLLWRKARPFYSLSLANVLLHRLDLLLLSAVVGEIITGIYSAAYLVVRVFLVLSQTYWQALYPTLSRLRQQSTQQYQRLSALGLRYGLIALLLVAALSSGVAGPMLGLIFRDESYRPAVEVFQFFVWSAPLFLLATFAVNLLLIEQRPRYSLMVALVHLVVVLLLLPLLAAALQAFGAALAVLLAMALSALTGLLLIKRARIPAGFPAKWPLLLLATLLVALLVRLLPLISSVALWPLHVLVSAALYLAILWRLGLISVQDLHLFQRAFRR